MKSGRSVWPPQLATLSLRTTLFLGAGLGILLPALLLAYFQFSGKFASEVNLRVRIPMQQYSGVLSRSMAAAVWNVDREAANALADEVMRNPDVVTLTVIDENRDAFVRRENRELLGAGLLSETRPMNFNGQIIGNLTVELTTQRIRRELIDDLSKMAVALVAQVLFSFAFIWLLFDRRVLRPLNELREGASRLARGELAQPLQWARHDEIGNLAQGLDNMRKDLSALIEERDQQHAALVVSQTKFAAIFNASPVAMSVSRMGDAPQVLDVNEAWVRLFHCAHAQALAAQSVVNGIWKDGQDRDHVWRTVVREQVISRHQAWMLPSDGSAAIRCEVSGQVIALGGERILILAYEDITAKSQYEANILALNANLEQRVEARTQELSDTLVRLTATQSELVRTEKLSALGSMVAGIAHELNTPIGNSLTVASSLQFQTREFTAAAAKGMTRAKLDAFIAAAQEGSAILLRSLHAAAELISSFKQVAVDQTSANRRDFKLKETVEEICLTLGPSVRKTSHSLESRIALDVVLDGYPGPFGQVLTNLINNALVHAFDGRRGGKIVIDADQPDAEHVRLTIQDNGSGIAPDHLARVFDPFFTTKLGQGGSGLGLNIVHNIVVKTLGGSIMVNSVAGQGACFMVTLPLEAPQSQSDSGFKPFP